MSKINPLQQNFIKQFQLNTPAQTKSDKPQFSETLKEMIKQVNAAQMASGQATQDFIAGKDIELHEVMAKGEEAQLSFQFMMEIRNKLLEAYQDVQRMQV